MSATSPLRVYSSPSAFGWMFALVSVVLASATAALGLAFNLQYRTARAHEKVVVALSQHDYTESRRLLEELASERPLERLVTGSRELEYRRVRSDAARELMSLSEQVRAVKLSLFSGTLERAKRALGILLEHDAALGTKWEKTGSLLQEHIEALERMQETRDTLAAAEVACAESLIAFVSHGERLAKLLGRPYEATSDCKAITAYSSGVFTGLPVINGIPDGLPDLVAVKGAIEKSGGQVVESGNNPHEEFVAELDTIKALSTTAWERNRRALSTLNAGVKELTLGKPAHKLRADRLQLLLTEVITYILRRENRAPDRAVSTSL